MKDNTKFYIVTVFISFVLTLIVLYWAWVQFGNWLRPPAMAQPVTIEETETPQVEDSKAIWCLENSILCKG